jgi:arylsulfatase
LYDLATDPTESDDLADRQPEKLQEMIALWDEYARRNSVVLPTVDTSYARVR